MTSGTTAGFHHCPSLGNHKVSKEAGLTLPLRRILAGGGRDADTADPNGTCGLHVSGGGLEALLGFPQSDPQYLL